MEWSIFELTLKILNDNHFIFTTFAAINNHKDQIQSISWRDNGQVFVTSCKDKRLRIIDPRSSSVVQVYYTNGYFKDDIPEKGVIIHVPLSSGFPLILEQMLCNVSTLDHKKLGSPILFLRDPSSWIFCPCFCRPRCIQI